MCRNIKRTRQPDRAPTDHELHDAALPDGGRSVRSVRAPGGDVAA